MDISEQQKIIVNHHCRLVARYHELGKTIAQLTAAGCIDAKEYWKGGKYLYLLYPMKDGVRRKKYVGSHPLRIEEARQKLANYKRRLDLILSQRKVQRDLADIEAMTADLLRICAKSDMSAQFAVAELEGVGVAVRILKPALSASA